MSASVLVSTGATIGDISVTGAPGTAFLQIVLVLTSYSNNDFAPSGTSRNLRLNGSGFSEDNTDINFGTSTVMDLDTGTNLVDVFSSGTRLDTVIPGNALATVSVTTIGGSSNNLIVGPTQFTGLQAVADQGTPTNGAQPLANVGQAITIQGQNLDPNTNVVFPTLTDTGVAGTATVRVSYVCIGGRTSATVFVPNRAATGNCFADCASPHQL